MGYLLSPIHQSTQQIRRSVGTENATVSNKMVACAEALLMVGWHRECHSFQ